MKATKLKSALLALSLGMGLSAGISAPALAMSYCEMLQEECENGDFNSCRDFWRKCNIDEVP